MRRTIRFLNCESAGTRGRAGEGGQAGPLAVFHKWDFGLNRDDALADAAGYIGALKNPGQFFG